MKIFSIAAMLTGVILVSLSVKRRKNASGIFTTPALPGVSEVDRRYAIDDLMNGLD